MTGAARTEKRTLEETLDSNLDSSKKQHLDFSSGRLNSTGINENTSTEKVVNTNELVKDTTLFNGVEISKLSKRQMKKFKKSLKWQDVKKVKRAREKLKAKQKRLDAKLKNIELGPSRKELKRKKMKDSPCKMGVCIDLSFDHLMIDKDIAKTIKQILRVYTENRRAKEPMQLHLTSFNDKTKEEMSRHNGHENWDIYFHSEDYLEGICYDKAVKQGIAHGQLPIGEYFWMRHRKVLTINQVFEILLRVSEGKSFKETLELVLPKRIEKISTSKEVHANKSTSGSSSCKSTDDEISARYKSVCDDKS
ncbi:hypothetical protein NQ317_013023 [Molorchus minor]|uniref:tRNA (guanine(9)-N(1))-methyltransferase n=1 Tax=Molorchus minor TaxID=1323400 RepID=A0ABQ9K3U5_9CUCU|nr:hypothetical protein NQ317_013023 [Molorchus minor]